MNVIPHIAPKMKNQVVLGLLGGHRIELNLPVHLPGNIAIRIPKCSLGNSAVSPLADGSS
jgi:hypothetical protein